MCNYHPNSQFNSHSRTVLAVTSQQKAPMEIHIGKDRTDEARRVIFKSPLGWHKAFNSQRRIKTTVGETLLMCLTVASGLILISYWLQPASHRFFFFPQAFKAPVVIAHTQRRKIQGGLTTQKDMLSTNTQSSGANTDIDYQAMAQMLHISKRDWRGKWKEQRQQLHYFLPLSSMDHIK